MKNKHFLTIFILVILAFWLWWKNNRLADKSNLGPSTSEAYSPSGPVPERKNAAPTLGVVRSAVAENNSGLIDRRRNQMQVTEESGNDQWRTPIEFYGKVVDENTNPVANATISFVWTDLSLKGNSEKQTTSDENGLFSLLNTSGKNLIVQVSKDGYYAYKPYGLAFNYAGENQNFVPDIGNQVIFRLKKKGATEPLIALDRTFQISVSGKPLEIDLRSGKAAMHGQEAIIVEFVKQPTEKTGEQMYDWSFKVTVPNGGLLQSTNEFDFTAPENGYASSDAIEMTPSMGGAWQNRIKRQYFLKFSDQDYCSVVFDLMSHNGSLRVQSFINPSGSRNLEFDSNNAIPSGQ